MNFGRVPRCRPKNVFAASHDWSDDAMGYSLYGDVASVLTGHLQKGKSDVRNDSIQARADGQTTQV